MPQLTHKISTVYKHIQTSASDTWVVLHNLGYEVAMYPAVDVYIDSDGSKFKMLPLEVVYDNGNQCTITFTSPQTGLATVA